MDNYERFKSHIKNIADQFNQFPNKPILVVSNYDSDGITSAAILVAALKRANRKFSLTIIKQLTRDKLKEFSKLGYEFIIFADLGSGALQLMEDNLGSKTIIILDHHKPEEFKTKFFHVNPHLFDIDGSREISAAGVTYLFAKSINSLNKDLAHIAIMGAIGDVQEERGFKGLNKEILEDAVHSGKIEIRRGLRMFGMQTKPLHKVLMYSTNPYIPNVTGSEEGALKFLNEIGIDPKKGRKWKKLIHLDEDDMKRLVTGVILRRIGSEKNPDDVLGPIFLLSHESDESPMKDAKEFSTLLNSCGRMKKPSVGIGTCLGSPELKEEAIEVSKAYKQEIIKGLNWFYQNKENNIQEDGYVIINAEDNIRDSMTSTLSSMIANSNIYREDTIIMVLAHTLDGKTKISLRKVGTKPNKDINLLAILKEIIAKIGGECGGHAYHAAGALIDQENEENFISDAQKVLKRTIIEQSV